jgi:hypothetical protein
MVLNIVQGRIQGGGLPPKIGKNMIFLRKIVIFLHEIPQKFSRLRPLGAIFLSAPPPNLKSWILRVVCSVMKYPVYTWNKVIRWHAAWQISFSGPPDTRGS